MRGYNTFANRGRDFEDFVIQVNDLYTRSGKAVVYKVPTEFLPIRDSTGQIKSCKVEHKSCVDFLGRYNGTPVAVEAKQTHTGRKLILTRCSPTRRPSWTPGRPTKRWA